MSASDWVHHFPGRAQCLRRVVEASDGATVTRAVLDATDVLRPIWEPLSAEATLFALEGNDSLTATLVDVAQPHRLLVKSPVSEGVRISAVMAAPVTATVDELSRQAIDAWLDDGLADVAPGNGQHGEWAELAFRACRAWVGPPGWRPDETELRLALGGSTGTVVAPVERTASGAWLSGPRRPASDQPPFELQFTHELGLVTLQLTRHYGYWLDSSEPAARRLDDLIDRLRAMGWGE
jgi:hypothetical protein